MSQPASPTSPRPRLAIIDMARGVAIIAMMAYHLCWDLSYFRFIAPDVGRDPFWVVIARTILFSFMFLVGVGLVLGHGRGIRWARFWRRFLLLLAGSLAITLATYLAFPDSFVYFGVLHAITLLSLMALPFVRTALILPIIVAPVFILLPFFWSDPLYNERLWSWIGLWQTPPPANDLVPVFPWFGIVLLGVVAARLVLASSLAAGLAAIHAETRLRRLLVVLGRWSLLIYLLHQPLLFGLTAGAASLFQPGLAMRDTDFLAACQSTCEAGGTPAALCVTYCQCGLEGVERNDLWPAISTGMVSAAEQALLDAQNRQCSALIYPELDFEP